MNQEQQHHMNLVETHPSGIEEWHCDQCERRMVMQWTPYKKLVLEEGDNYALHSAQKGHVQMQDATVHTQTKFEDTPILSEDLRDALDDFLRDLDFGD